MSMLGKSGTIVKPTNITTRITCFQTGDAGMINGNISPLLKVKCQRPE